MFVDDSLFSNTGDLIKHAIAASIEALFLVLGFPDEPIRQNPLSLDKYLQSLASFSRIQLGRQVHTRRLSVGITEIRRTGMVTELSNWPKKRKSFTLMQGVKICGDFGF